MRILVVDDDRAVRESLRRSLEFNGYDVALATDGAEALARINGLAPDAVIIDVMMPRLDGIETTKALRTAGNDVPILVLTARDAVGDRVDGLDAGADDYLTKPFALEELLARLRALLRRRTLGIRRRRRRGRSSFADLTMNLATREVERGGRQITLTRTECTCSRCSCAGPSGCSSARSSSRRSGATTSRRPPTRSRSTSATCAARPRPRASPGCCTPCAASATCCARRPP